MRPLLTSLEIRRAELRDMGHLSRLCRSGFPWTAKWGFAPPFILKWWWRGALSSDTCEAWVATEKDRVIGFYVLVTDLRQWRYERLHRRGSLLVRAFLLLCRPRTWMFAARQRFKQVRHKTRDKRDVRQEAAWLDWMSVDPPFRGLGVGKKLLDHCEHRCRENDRSVLRLDVYKRNRKAQKFYVCSGYHFEGETGQVRKYGKRLSEATTVGL